MHDALDILWQQPWVGALAFTAVLVLTPLVIRLARAYGWVAHPRSDRWHATPTALMGGIAIYAGATLALLVTSPAEVVGPIWIGATLMFLTGLIDDLYGVQPAAKLAMQVAATSILLYAGYAFGDEWAIWVALPLTLVWVVGITNAINLLDNMDGLSAGVSGIAASAMVVFAAMTGSNLAVLVGVPVVGAAFGFLVYNFKPARIFMGDCGSLFLGFVVAALGLVIQKEAVQAGPLIVALVPLTVLAVPIFDTTLVTLVRKLSGRAVSQGGRDHSSHRLVFLGLTERHAVLMLYALSLLSGTAALTALYVGERLFFAFVAILSVVLVTLGIQLGRANVYEEEVRGDGAPPRGFQPLHLLHNLMGHHWKAVFGVFADALLVGAVFVVAHSLRFEGGVPAAHAERLVQVLPLVVALKVSVFYGFGLYRGIWRHSGTPELLRLAGATVVATVATGGLIALLFAPSSLSLGVLIVDWMMSVLAIGGIRFGFRGLREYLAAKNGTGAPTLVYGAGTKGTLSVRVLRHDDSIRLKPIGFLDDDPLKQGLYLQGLPVLGTGTELADICRTHDVDTVLVASSLPARRKRHVVKTCDALGISCQSLCVEINPLEATEPDRPSVSIPISTDI